MKLIEHIATVESNAVFDEVVKMSVENESISHIIKSLTDMYSNPMLALSREYLSNAYDACIARMGSTSSFGTVLDTPIEVTLPNNLNPNFIVRDYGIGMDREVLGKVFPKYGASTKRTNNNEIGGFGLGAKSALAVVSNFTVSSVKDGKKNVGIVQKSSDGVAEISFLPEQPTSEPSGTVITIALPNPHALVNIFRNSDLLLGFPHGSILLNGKMHDNSVFNTDLYTKVSEDGWVTNSLLTCENSDSHPRALVNNGEMLVVVGPISYKLTHDSFKDVEDWTTTRDMFSSLTRYVVLNLPIGSVDFTPARESLIFSERTIDTIRSTARRLESSVKELIDSKIANAPTRKDAVEKANLLRESYIDCDFTYKGETIPEMKMTSLHVEGKTAWVSRDGGYRSAAPYEYDLQHMNGRSDSVIIITGVTDYAESKKLNRFRKPFDSRYERKTKNYRSLTLLYTQATKAELPSWADALVSDIFTVEEWEAEGTAFRKLINDESKARRLATGVPNVASIGSVPVSKIAANRTATNERPKVHSVYSAEIAGSNSVIYIQANKNENSTLSHKFSVAMGEGGPEAMDVRSMNSAINAVDYHYRKDGKTVSIVRIPANTKLSTFLQVIPHAISMDEAVKVVAVAISKNQDDALTFLAAHKGKAFHWLESMRPLVRESIANEEVREFIAKAAEASTTAQNYRTNAESLAYGAFVFAKGLSDITKEARKTVEESNKFPLPLLDAVGLLGSNSVHAVQYINLMYPATV